MTGIGIALAAVGINVLYAIRHGHNIVLVLTGGVILTFFVAALDSLPGSHVGTAVAGTFLLGTIVYRAQDLFTFLTGLLNQKGQANA